MAFDDDIRTIKTQISQAQGQKARASVQLENAQERVAEGRARLKEEFGVVETSEAKAVLTQLDAELQEALDTVRRDLAEAGA